MSTVSVCARFRPLNAKEIAHEGESCCILKHDDSSFVFKDESEAEEFSFSFDRVFYEDATQEEVFNFVAMPVVKDALNAINGTVLLYGQTGSGKTHSMEGLDDHHNKGILPRVAHSIFQFIEDADPSTEFILKLSMVEIHMDRIRDLFDPSKDNLQVKEDRAHGVFVAGASEMYIQTEEEMLKLLKAGATNRAVGATQMNANSSRSHCVYMINIQQTGEDRSVKIGKLFLVDLAGSEKLEKTCAEGKLLTEAKAINKSLSSLGNVISALTHEKAYHIPYRDSKLTRILQDALGGNCRTTLLCCCSSSSFNSAETLSTLRFGLRAKEIKNKPKINTERSRHELELMLSRSEAECESLKSQAIMLNARINSLMGDDKGTLTLNSCAQERGNINFADKLRLAFSKKAPNLEEVIHVIGELFEEEGLLGDEQESKNVDDRVLAMNQDVLQTVGVLQTTVKELAENFDKVVRENEALENEVIACRALFSSGPGFCTSESRNANNTGRARVIRPLKGGTLAAAQVVTQFQDQNQPGIFHRFFSALGLNTAI